MSNSNLNGRLFEYLIAEDIKREFGSSSFFTRNTIKDNERDKQKLNQISNETLPPNTSPVNTSSKIFW
jgi:hypothetical protein